VLPCGWTTPLMKASTLLEALIRGVFFLFF